MKNRMIALFLLVLAVGLYSTEIGYLGFTDPLNIGSESELMVNVYNNGQEDMEDTRVSLWIPDLDFYWMGNGIDVEEGEKHAKWLFPEIPADVQPGSYLSRIKVSSDHTKDVKWLYLNIQPNCPIKCVLN